MLSSLRSRALSSIPSSSSLPWRPPPHLLGLGYFSTISSSSSPSAELMKYDNRKNKTNLLEIDEVEAVLNDVRAGDVRVIPVPGGSQVDVADYKVVATGRSLWHVRNIAQALLHKIKQKQKGSDKMKLPAVQGREAGKWIVIDSGNIIIHALDEKAREYYDLDSLWKTQESAVNPSDLAEDLERSLVKVRRRDLSEKPMKSLSKKSNA